MTSRSINLRIEGMTCASCVSHVEQALRQVPSVTEANVNLATATAHINSGEDVATALVAAVKKAGYEARPVALNDASPASNQAQQDQLQAAAQAKLVHQFRWALSLSLPLLIFEMGGHFIPQFHHWLSSLISQQFNWGVQFLLASLVIFGPGWVFYRKGVPSLIRLHPDMNTLVALGTFAAWSYSAVATFKPQLLPAGTLNVYYEAAAVIVTLVLLGRLLESGAKARTHTAIAALVKLQPQTANRLRDGEIEPVPIASLQLGDQVLVKPGERIPLDGEITQGSSYIDESMMTGEPIPTAKQQGAQVLAGTLNTTGAFHFRVSKLGKDTLLAQIIQLVENAQGSKLPVQALVDKITAWFVPGVILASALTFITWLIWGPTPALGLAIVNAVAVLIIACPCAMGLATPTSIMVATGRAASMGLLFRNGAALQSLAEIKLIAFDKTGTLTHGKPTLVDIQTTNGFSESDLLRWAASAESHSEHPIASALVNAAKERNLTTITPDNFIAHNGEGLTATIEGKNIILGGASFLKSQGAALNDLEVQSSKLADEGKTPIFMAVDHQAAAIMGLADSPKAEAFSSIKTLQATGIKVAMITGDNRNTAEYLARELHIDLVFAQVLPQEKVAALKQLRHKYGALAFVGDGINDAPALVEADLGIAIGTGTDIAIDSSDVVLVRGNIEGVAQSLELARATMRNIKQNLFWAFAYNAALIPLAAGVAYPHFGILLSPMLGAGAMALSSLFVISNALRLKSFKPSHQIR